MRALVSRLLVATALLSAPATVSAHRQWLLPSTTSVSGTDNWVTVDAAVSNDLFYPDHFPMPTESVQVWQPDGSTGAIQNAAKGRYRSTFDVQLDKPGTWKIGTASTSISGSFKLNGEDWTVGRRRGPPQGTPGQPPRPEAHSVATVADIPAGATDLKLTEMSSRNEIFVTAGAPTTTVLKPTGQGLDMLPVTHPDALVSNEPARFRFLIDGKPAAGLKVTLIPGGKRYRDSEGVMELTTGTDGVLEVKWPEPGMYWLNATATDNRATTPRATERRMSYVSTLEVMAP
jgi:uncharacterized GH25 family protein